MKRLKIFLLLLIICLGIFMTGYKGLYYYSRSLLIMLPYSYVNYRSSLLYSENINLSIPGGLSTKERNWFPFVMTYTADEGFSNFTGTDYALTILYNFPYFDLKKGGSVYFQPDSPFYSSFYGAYIIQNKNNPELSYGFSDNQINVMELEEIPKYDQLRLVLPSLGVDATNRIFEARVDQIFENISYLGMEGWTQIDSTIITNGPLHRYEGHQSGYLQFGLPPRHFDGEAFTPITLKGRAYAKYFEEAQVTIVFYIMGKDEQFINRWDQALLSKSRVRLK